MPADLSRDVAAGTADDIRDRGVAVMLTVVCLRVEVLTIAAELHGGTPLEWHCGMQ
jgi:hypothetical protein